MDADRSKETPVKPTLLRESEFFGGCIRVKISVKNTSSLAILDAALELESDERILHFDRCEPEYPEKKGKILLGNLDPNTDRTVALYLDPLICAKEGTNVNCRIFFKDAFGRSNMVQMEPLKIKVVCPIFRTEQDVNIGRLKELISGLQFHDSKVYTIPRKVEISELLRTCRNVIQLHDVRHIKTFKTTDERTYEAWYYGKTKVTKKDLVVKCCIRRDTESIEVFASGNDPGDITGLLAEIGRNLTKEFEKLGKVQPVFNIHIKDSIIQRSNLLSFCDLDGTCGGNVVIEDSVVQRSNIASWNEAAQKEREEAQKREKEEQELLRKQKEQEERALRESKAQDAEKREKEEARQEVERRLREEKERIAKEREKLSVSEKKKGFSQIKFLAVILLLGVLVLGYWTMAPYEKKAPETLKSTPTPTPAVVATTAIPAVAPTSDQKNITNSIGMEFVLIPVGEFDMGSPSNEAGRWNAEGPVHRVKISNAFYMGKYEVTQKQWRDVMGTNPSNFKGDNLPVEYVSWNEVQEFIKKLNEKEGANKYRLPSEAEWEYAARAGTTTRYSFGDDESKLSDYAWYTDNSGSKTHEVGTKKPNPWGLYDVHGNVWEWVQDKWYGNYNGAPTDGSVWEGDGSVRVVRGGGWDGGAGDCRSANRNGNDPASRSNYVGFRLVMEINTDLIKTQNITPAISIPASTANQNTFTSSTGIEFVQIPAGEFDMGSLKNEWYTPNPVHRVNIPKAFYMGKYEVTQKQWGELMGNNISFPPYISKGDNLPVIWVSWNDVQDFIKKLNEQEGTNKYRLPSEAEWEYAVRARTNTTYFFGDNISELGDYAWYNEIPPPQPNPIAQKKPNPWGLYDMYGDVREWMQDIYHGNYNGAPTNGSAWEGVGFTRVIRGGSCFKGKAGNCGSAFRSYEIQGTRNGGIGFRLVRKV